MRPANRAIGASFANAALFIRGHFDPRSAQASILDPRSSQTSILDPRSSQTSILDDPRSSILVVVVVVVVVLVIVIVIAVDHDPLPSSHNPKQITLSLRHN